MWAASLLLPRVADELSAEYHAGPRAVYWLPAGSVASDGKQMGDIAL